MALYLQRDVSCLQKKWESNRLQERESLEALLLQSGLIDTFRQQFPSVIGQLWCNEPTSLDPLCLSLIRPQRRAVYRRHLLEAEDRGQDGKQGLPPRLCLGE